MTDPMPDARLDEIEARVNSATGRGWDFDGYCRIISAETVQRDEAFWNEKREQDNHTYSHRVGEICPGCGERPAILKDGSRVGTYWDCALWTEAYEADSVIAYVTAHHGDTAIGQRVADAEFIAHSRQDVEDLTAEVRRLRAELAAAWDAVGGVEVAMSARVEVGPVGGPYTVVEESRERSLAEVLTLAGEGMEDVLAELARARAELAKYRPVGYLCEYWAGDPHMCKPGPRDHEDDTLVYVKDEPVSECPNPRDTP